MSVHYLYGTNSSVTIKKIISDGRPYHRVLDEDRIIWRLLFDEVDGKTPLRDHVSLIEAEIVHLLSDHKLYAADTEEYTYANLLQVADLLLGSVIRSCHIGCTDWPRLPTVGVNVKGKRDVIAYPVKEMLHKMNRGRAFTRSGHYTAIPADGPIASDISFKE